MAAIDIGQRLKAARERCGKTPNQIIASVGITFNSYWDLECGHDWFENLALKDICSLAQTVDLTPSELLIGHPCDPVRVITLEHLRDKLIEWLDNNNLTLGAFETRVGYEVKSFVRDSRMACNWNIDSLRAVCESIGVDWEQVLFCQQALSKPTLKPLSLGAIARDVGIIFALTFAGGFIIGASGLRHASLDLYRMVDSISNVILIAIGFAIVGSLVVVDRWKHLLSVAIISWIASLVNCLFGKTIEQWMAELPYILILMGIGGSVSYLIRR